MIYVLEEHPLRRALYVELLGGLRHPVRGFGHPIEVARRAAEAAVVVVSLPTGELGKADMLALLKAHDTAGLYVFVGTGPFAPEDFAGLSVLRYLLRDEITTANLAKEVAAVLRG
jgi:hypothetical protein